jgi:hypothetical protein
MLERTKEKYEILIRLEGDNAKGAHFKDIEKISDNGVVISAIESPAQPISIAEVIELLQASELAKEVE